MTYCGLFKQERGYLQGWMFQSRYARLSGYYANIGFVGSKQESEKARKQESARINLVGIGIGFVKLIGVFIFAGTLSLRLGDNLVRVPVIIRIVRIGFRLW